MLAVFQAKMFKNSIKHSGTVFVFGKNVFTLIEKQQILGPSCC